MRAAFSTSSSSSSAMVASAAASAHRIAAESGSVRSRRPRHQFGPRNGGAQRHAAGDSFGHGKNVRHGVEMIGCPHLAGAAHAGLHFVENQKNIILFRRCATARRRICAAEQCTRLRPAPAPPTMAATSSAGATVLQQRLFDELHALHRAAIGLLAVGAAIAVRIGSVHHAGHQWAESFALHGLARGERKGAHGAAVESAVERDDFIAAGGVARQFDGAFHGLRAGVPERHAPSDRTWRDLRQLLGQRHHLFVIEIRARHVDQAGCLFLNRVHHAGMAMAGGHHRDPGVEIQKAIAIHVLDHRPFAALANQWIAARVGGRQHTIIPFDQRLRARPGQGSHQARKVRAHLIQGLSHFHLLLFSCWLITRNCRDDGGC